MKNLALLIVFMLILSTINSQSKANIVAYYDWSSPIHYQLTASPVITGYGLLSDSLAKAHNDSTFYEYNGEYYPITCWADYYLWYVNKFWFNFIEPDLYEYFYYAKDDYGMTRYLCDNNFTGPEYPSRIAVSFPGQDVCTNNLSYGVLKRNMKQQTWVNKNYLAKTETGNNKNPKTEIKQRVREENKNFNLLDSEKIASYSIKNRESNMKINPSKAGDANYTLSPNRNHSTNISNTNQLTKNSNSSKANNGNKPTLSTKTGKEK